MSSGKQFLGIEGYGPYIRLYALRFDTLRG